MKRTHAQRIWRPCYKKVCLNTNKTAGRDQISVKFVKRATDVLAYLLSKIMNLLIQLSVLLEECKITRLKPVRKAQKRIPKTKRDHF